MRRRLDYTREILLLGEGRIEITHRVDRVKEPQEMNLALLPAESRLEVLHEVLSVLRRPIPTRSHLVFLVGPIRERDHLLVAFREQANGGDHASEEASGERSSREAKDEDLVAGVMIPHDEAISSDDMMVEARPYSLIYGLSQPPLDPPQQAGVHGLVTRNVRPDSSYKPSRVSPVDY